MTEFECHVLKLLILIANGDKSIMDLAYLVNLENEVDMQLKGFD